MGATVYLALKFLHVIGASVLFGTGLGIAYFLFRAERKEATAALAATLRGVVIADYVFTATAAIAQPLTGFALVHVGGYDLGQTWLWASLALSVLLCACWLPVVYLPILSLCQQKILGVSPLNVDTGAGFITPENSATVADLATKFLR